MKKQMAKMQKSAVTELLKLTKVWSNLRPVYSRNITDPYVVRPEEITVF